MPRLPAPHWRSLLLVLLLLAPALTAQPTPPDLQAPDGTTVTIERDAYGVPHIAAETEAGVFFGQGFVTAQDRLAQLADLMRVATGTYAATYGPGPDIDGNGVGDYIDADRWVREMSYTAEERAAQFQTLAPPVRAMVEAYRDGINAYLDLVDTEPETYRPADFPGVKRWDTDKVMAVTQYVMRQFGQLGGDELARQAEFDGNGPDWFAANRPINDPTAPTTIAASGTPGIPNAPTLPAAGRWAGLDATDALARLDAGRAALDRVRQQAGLAPTLGSFAVAANGSATTDGRALLLAAPQMGDPQLGVPNPALEFELIAPTYHAAGMTVPGIPGILIGRVADHAWTLTTGNTDNTDTFLAPLQGNRYRFEGAARAFERISGEIAVAGAVAVPFEAVRTVHGPVYGVVTDEEVTYAAAWRMTFWEREAQALESFYAMARATNVDQFQTAVERMPMSFNVLYADRAGQIAYWHAGAYPDRAATVAPRLPALGDGTEEWQGLVPFAQQPQQRDPASGFFVNWNNKPRADWNHGDHLPWTATPSNGFVRTYDGVAILDAAVQARTPLDFERLTEIYRVVQTNSTYPEYPGTYQQVVAFGETIGEDRAENLLPPGQSAFVSQAGVPSAHVADQWPLYLSAGEDGPVRLKPMAFARVVDTASEEAVLPETTDLGAAYPNPVRAGTTLSIPLPRSANAASTFDLALYDVLGRRVATLASDTQAADTITVRLDVAPGSYVVRLVDAERVVTQRIVVAR